MNAARDFDFLACCRPGMTLRTRDRREARILAVDAAAGVLHGEVPMLGSCIWRGDGRYQDAPAGAAGPWDLMPPQPARSARTEGAHGSLSDALNRGDANPGCCD
jgi:hypothetical protein